jgi:hypothetical protein
MRWQRHKQPSSGEIVFDQEKFDNLVLYVASKCPDPTKLGAVRLRKILYYADSLHYMKTRKPIAGATYIKWEKGPVPRQLQASLDRLEKRGALVVKQGAHPYGYPMTFYYALKEPDIKRFDAEEISLVDGLIQTICSEYTAESISKLSHHNAWEVAAIGEELPYETIFARWFGEINEDALAWAKEEIRRYEVSKEASEE